LKLGEADEPQCPPSPKPEQVDKSRKKRHLQGHPLDFSDLHSSLSDFKLDAAAAAAREEKKESKLAPLPTLPEVAHVGSAVALSAWHHLAGAIINSVPFGSTWTESPDNFVMRMDKETNDLTEAAEYADGQFLRAQHQPATSQEKKQVDDDEAESTEVLNIEKSFLKFCANVAALQQAYKVKRGMTSL
jgi:hypothetical protein